jgi:hypothetical protein
MTHHTLVALLPSCAQGGTFLIGEPAGPHFLLARTGPKRFIGARGAQTFY